MPSKEENLNKNMKAEYEKIADESFFLTSDGSEIRILSSNAQKGSGNRYTLLLLPGWNTVVPGWNEVLMEATKDFDTLYIESREKGSSKLANKTRNDVNRHSSDIQEVLNKLNINQNRLIIFTSSFSVFLAADGLAKKKFSPLFTIFLGPSWRFNMPPTTRYIMHVLPNFFLGISKPIWRWWIKKHKSEDPKQAAKYIRALEEADAKKWRTVAKRFAFTHFRETYDQIDDHIIVVGMEKDKMHKSKEAKNIADFLKNSTYIDMGTNKKTHSEEMVKEIRKLIKKFESNN